MTTRRDGSGSLLRKKPVQQIEDEAGGSGLGLAISAAIVALHGGSVSTGVSPEGWCRFSVVLPVSAPGGSRA